MCLLSWLSPMMAAKAGTKVTRLPNKYAREHLRMPRPFFELRNVIASFQRPRACDANLCKVDGESSWPGRSSGILSELRLSRRLLASRSVNVRLERSPVVGEMKDARLSCVAMVSMELDETAQCRSQQFPDSTSTHCASRQCSLEKAMCCMLIAMEQNIPCGRKIAPVAALRWTRHHRRRHWRASPPSPRHGDPSRCCALSHSSAHLQR